MKTGESEIQAAAVIDPAGIDRANYFMSLVSAAAEAGILPPGEVAAMQSQIYDVLADVIWMYNNGTSASVFSELAEEFIKSIVFALDCFCIVETGRGLSNEQCVGLLSGGGAVRRCYERGIGYIEKLQRSAWKLYREVAAAKPDIDVALYNETLDRAIPEALRGYQRYFHAHNAGAEMFYPLAMADTLDCKGILYIREYLRHIWIENRFCACFSAEDIRKLLGACAGRLRACDLMENVFELVYSGAFFAALDGKPGTLLTGRERCGGAARMLEGKEEAELAPMLKKCAVKLLLSLGATEPMMRGYVFRYNEKFVQRVVSAARDGRVRGMMAGMI